VGTSQHYQPYLGEPTLALHQTCQDKAQILKRSPVTMNFSTRTLRPCRSYSEFLNNVLEPVNDSPAGEVCAVCRLYFVKEEEHISSVMELETTTQAKILAAAIAAATAAAEPATNNDVVRVRRCGHVFHKECVCTWITDDVEAPGPRRSCPCCKIELVRFGSRSRVDAFFHRFFSIDKEIDRVTTPYKTARIKYQAIEDLELDLETMLGALPKDLLELSHSSKLTFVNKLESVLQEDPDCAQDMIYLEQLLLDGHTIYESVKLWYEYKLDMAEKQLRSQCKNVFYELFLPTSQLEIVLEGIRRLLLFKMLDQGYSWAEAESSVTDEFLCQYDNLEKNLDVDNDKWKGWVQILGPFIERINCNIRWGRRQLFELRKHENFPIYDLFGDSMSTGDSEEEQEQEEDEPEEEDQMEEEEEEEEEEELYET